MKKTFNCVSAIYQISLPESNKDLAEKTTSHYRIRIESSRVISVEEESIDSYIDQGARSVITYDTGDELWQLHIKEPFEECCDFWDKKDIFTFLNN